MKLLQDLFFRDERVELHLGRYGNGRVALQLFEPDGELVITLTVNLEDEECEDEELWINISDHHEGVDAWLQEHELIGLDPVESSLRGAIKYKMTPKLLNLILDRLVSCGQRSRR